MKYKQTIQKDLSFVGELLRATMKKNEKSIGQNKKKLTVRLLSYILPMRITI